MVFQKNKTKSLQGRFKKGYTRHNKGNKKAGVIISDTSKPYVRLTKERYELVEKKSQNSVVRLLRPKQSDKPEVEKSAECKPDTR